MKSVSLVCLMSIGLWSCGLRRPIPSDANVYHAGTPQHVEERDCRPTKGQGSQVIIGPTWTITDTGRSGVVNHRNGRRTFFWEDPSSTGDECSSSTKGQVVSIVGDVVSFVQLDQLICPDQAHATGGLEMHAVDVNTGNAVSLYSIFGRDVVQKALDNTRWYRSCVRDAWSSDHCDRNPDGIEYHFAVKDVRDNVAVVEIGLTHGSQANVLTIGGGDIYIPIPASLLPLWHRARDCRWLKKDLGGL